LKHYPDLHRSLLKRGRQPLAAFQQKNSRKARKSVDQGKEGDNLNREQQILVQFSKALASSKALLLSS
jgi:hypothetical protein